MAREVEVRDITDEVGAGQTPALASPDMADPLRATRKVKWLTRLFVYPGVTLLIPLDHLLSGLTWQQAISVHLGGFVIATLAIEFAFGQMFKLRKRSAYPGVLLAELGRGLHAESAAPQALGVIQRLLGVNASFLALGPSANGASPMSVSGISRETAERVLKAGMPNAREATRSQRPMPFTPPDVPLPETLSSRNQRWVFIPVVALQQAIGVLAVAGSKGNGDLKDSQLLSGIGSALGLSMENLRQKQELRESEERLRKQNRTLAELANSKTLNRGDLNAAVREITEAAARAFGVERASVWFYSDDRSRIHCIDLYELSARRHSEGVELAAADYPAYFKALEEERTIAAHDAHTDPRTKGFSDSYLTPLGITSMMDAPIRVGGHLAGVICHEHVGPARKWSLEEQNLAGSMADFVSLAIETYERKQAEQALRGSEEKFRTLAETGAAATFIYQGTRVRYVNSAAEALTGYTREELLAMDFWDIVHPDSRELVRERGLARQRGEDVPRRYEVNLQTKDGEERWVDITLGVIEFEGKPAVLGTGFDITERRRAEEALRESEEKFRTLAETAAAATFIYQGTRLRYVNSATIALTGYTREELLAMNFWDVMHPDCREQARERGLARQRGEDVPARTENKLLTKNGEERWVDITAGSIEFEGKKAVLGTAFDITERRRAEETIKHLAYHDALTDLPNRALLNERLTVALAQARRKKRVLAVLFLDLDQFKVVNDTVGHAEGDRLLRSVAQRLTALVREGDTVARLGGDEFALLLSEIFQAEEAAEVAERILEDFRRPWVLQGREFHVTTSIGIALHPGDGNDAESLLRNADTAMYRAKEQGRDNFQLYTPAMNARIAERLAMENSLHHGLERGEFVVHYQPQVNIDTGQIVGMEALVRWQHPERGLVMPAEFIPVAEDTGLIVPLGEWVLCTACAQNKAWQEAGLPPLRVAVNLSARQFQQRNLKEKVAQVLRETGLDPHCLQLEITEGVAMQDVDFTIAVLRDLRAMGVQISIDDFGTGYSSLAYLKRFPIDVVKIDRSFVRDLTVDESDAAIAVTVIAIAHNLALKVIAEGVETEGQLDFLRQRQCDEMQGYLFSRPVPAEELEKMLVQGKRRSRAKIAVDSS